jgi:hypothetical protein
MNIIVANFLVNGSIALPLCLAFILAIYFTVSLLAIE